MVFVFCIMLMKKAIIYSLKNGIIIGSLEFPFFQDKLISKPKSMRLATLSYKNLTSLLPVPKELIWFDLVSLFNGISTFVGYLKPKPSLQKNSSGTI